jgi:uncharacterized membrane protein (DUF2068 family)
MQPGIFRTPSVAHRHQPFTVGRVSSHLHRSGLRTIALFEALKGALVLILGFGLLSFLGPEDARFAEQVVLRMHLDPANHYLQLFLQTISEVSDTRLWIMTGFAIFYAAIRFLEAYGLWRERRWAEWFAALSGGVYIPIEIYELAVRVTWLRFAALMINLVVVAYMIWLLTERRRLARDEKKLTATG